MILILPHEFSEVESEAPVRSPQIEGRDKRMQ